jgi:hypothetical protein
MSKYAIKRWDPVILHKQTFPYPAIYIKPDEKFKKFVKKNKNSIKFKIIDSGTMYDNTFFRGVVSDMPNVLSPPCDWISKNGYITITIDALWVQYPDPDTLGSIVIDMNNEITNIKSKDTDKETAKKTSKAKNNTKEKYIEMSNNEGCNSNFIFFFCIFILFFLILNRKFF